MYKILVYVIIIFSSFRGHGQEYPVRIFTSNDGLSQMQVLSVFKDSRGYIWVGTKYGISKYNGVNFTRYKPIKEVLGPLVSGFDEDKSGNLYITSSEGLCRFDGKTFTKIKSTKGQAVTVAVDKQNEIYALKDNEIFKINANDSLETLNWPSLKNKKFSHILFDKRRDELIGIIDLVGIVSIKKAKLELLYGLKNAKERVHYENSKNGEAIIQHVKGEKSVYYYLGLNKKIKAFLKTGPENIEVLNPVPFIFPILNNNKAYVLEAGTKQMQLIDENILSVNDSPCYVNNGFYLPSEQGLVFVATNGFRYFKKTDVPNCWSVIEDKYHRLWFWNYASTVKRWDGNKIETVNGFHAKMQLMLNSGNHNGSERPNGFWYFGGLKDKYGNIWQSNASGILRFDYKKYDFFVSPKQDERLSYSLLEDPAKNIILSGGVNSVQIFENKPPFKVRRLTPKEGLNVGNYVLCMALEKPGVYWFGGNNMISRYDSNLKKWKEFSQKNGKNDTEFFRDLLFDNRKTLWVASGEKGLYRYDLKLDSLISMPSEELHEPISFVGQMDINHLLIGSLRHLYVLDLTEWYKNKKVVLKSFNNQNGFMGIEPNQKGFFKDSKGFVWVTSGTVLSQIDPRKLDLKSDSLRTYFTKFNGEDIPFYDEKLKYTSKGDVRIEFESVGENKAVESQYSYAVDDVKEWSAWQMEPVVTLSKLASGNYKIFMRSRTGNGDKSYSKLAKLNFKVDIMPWESPYFPIYALLILMAVAGAFAANNISQNNKNRKVKVEIEKQEQQLHQQELENKGQALKVQALQVQTAQAQMNPHFTFNVLYAMQNLIYGNNVKAANENLLKLSRLMRSYLDASIKSEMDPNEPEKGMIGLDKEIELLQMYIDFEKLKYGDAFDAKINVSEEISTDFYKLPPLLIQPFVENAIVHGVIPNTKIRGSIIVDFRLDQEENLICTISDNGIGRKEASIRKQNQIKSHISRGTELINKRVEILKQIGIKIDIQTIDNVPSGTKVIIKIEP
jgi:hypothetical protein